MKTILNGEAMIDTKQTSGITDAAILEQLDETAVTAVASIVQRITGRDVYLESPRENQPHRDVVRSRLEAMEREGLAVSRLVHGVRQWRRTPAGTARLRRGAANA